MRALFLKILFSIFFSIFGYGQVTLFSETNTKEYETREPFTLSIGLEIAGNHLEQESPIKLPDLSKFEILGNASETIFFVNQETGNLVKQIVYQLILQPKQIGKIKIGSALVKINGKTYKSEPFDILVKENSKKAFDFTPHKNLYLAIETPNDAVRYQYEPIIITLKAYGNKPHHFRKINQIQPPKLHQNFIKLDENSLDIEQVDENTISQTIASFIFFPENLGHVVIPAVLAKFDKEKISSNPLVFDIKPLPQGAPKGFKNAVGNFKLEVITPNQEIIINKPIDIVVKLSGEGNFNHISLPQILKSDDYKMFSPKRKVKTIPSQNGLQGEITEHYVIIPQKSGEINIDLEEFSFFNYKENQYTNTSKSHSIQVEVDSLKEKSTIKKMIEDTGHILKKTELLPTSSENKDTQNNWLPLWVGCFIITSLIGIFFLVFKRRKRYIPEKTKKITTIAETEEIIKKSLFIGKDYYLCSMKKAIEQNNSTLFFDYYKELHESLEEQISHYEGKSLEEFLNENFKAEYVREFYEFLKKIQNEKYAPIHQNLDQYLQEIEKFYSKIMK